MVRIERVVESMPVTLCLHVVVFNPPLIWKVFPPTHVTVVFHCVSVVVQRQIGHLGVVTFIEINVFRLHSVAMLPVVGGCQHFHSVPHELTIKLHKQADQGQIVGWDPALHLSVVLVAEGRIE